MIIDIRQHYSNYIFDKLRGTEHWKDKHAGIHEGLFSWNHVARKYHIYIHRHQLADKAEKIRMVERGETQKI